MIHRYINGYILFPLLEKKAQRLILPKQKELKSFSKLSLAQQEEIRKKSAHHLLSHCLQNVPYYRDIFQAQGFQVDSVLKDLKYIQDLPVLTKALVRENTERIRLPAAIHERKTGGSTGQSVFFYYDTEGLDWTAAINLEAYDMARSYRHRSDAHIGADLGFAEPEGRAKLLDSLKLAAQNRQRLPVHSFSDEDLMKSYLLLKKIRPYMLQGHPSSGYAIAEFIKRKKFRKQKYCSVYEPSGEALNQKMVDSIEENLGCKVVNRYGNAEFGVVAHSRWKDPWTKLQVFNKAFFVEEVEDGPIIATSFTNYSFPLIRYDTGDVATVRNTNEGTFIENIKGRVHDIFKIDGVDFATHYIMDYLDHKIRGVREFQIVLEENQDPILKLVSERAEDQDRIAAELKAKWPKGLNIQFVQFEDFEKVGWQNKFRHLIDKRKK